MKNQSSLRHLLPWTAVVLFGLLAWRVGAQIAGDGGGGPILPPFSLALPESKPLPAPSSYPEFANLPAVPIGAPQPYPVLEGAGAGVGGGGGRNAIYPGTPGLTRPVPLDRSGTTFAILSDRTAGSDWGAKYLTRSVEELNRLRPELVLCVGDLVQGYTRSGEDYVREAVQVRQTLDQLAMPWYAAPGNHDVIAGTRDPKDWRFEALYQKYFGSLYYGLDYNDIHFIVLDSEEQLASLPVMSDAQFTWLKNDLARAFENKHIAHVFVVVHKPMWRYEKSNWQRVHQLLVEFNHRPIVAIEGSGTGGGGAGKGDQGNTGTVAGSGGGKAGMRGARVEAVFAGHVHSYIKDPPREGIGYYVLSVTGGQIDQDAAAGQVQSYLMVKVDAQGPHLSLVEPFANQPDDYVIAADRAILDQIEKIKENQIGIEGVLEQPVGKAVGSRDIRSPAALTLLLNNPLTVPLDVSIRLASVKNLVTATQRDAANAYTDNYDSPWELYVPYESRHLAPGDHLNYAMSLFCGAQNFEVASPQVEFVVRYTDSKGRSVPTLLKRRVSLIPSVEVPVLKAALNDKDWTPPPPAPPSPASPAALLGLVAAPPPVPVHARTYAQIPSPYDLPVPSPEFMMLADRNHLYVKIHVDDVRPSYFPNFIEPANLACDAVAVSFAPNAATPVAQAQRIVVLPFAPKAPQLLTNSGVGKEQTPLLPLDTTRYPVQASVTRVADGYDLLIALPRSTLFSGINPDNVVLNVTVVNNDDSAHSTFRAWTRDDLGPKVWGRVKLKSWRP